MGHLLVKSITNIQEIKENLEKLGNYLVSEDIVYLIETILHNYLVPNFKQLKVGLVEIDHIQRDNYLYYSISIVLGISIQLCN